MVHSHMYYYYFFHSGGIPDYHVANVHFIKRFRRGDLGRVLLDREQLTERRQQFLLSEQKRTPIVG